MKLSVFSPVFGDKSLEETLKYLSSKGVDGLELGAGGFPGKAHADVFELKNSSKKLEELKLLFDKYNMEISAISVHGNGVHPQKEVANLATEELESAIFVAEKLGVKKVVTFSGCPGDGKGDKPNWVTCCWPHDYEQILQYQWNDVLIPYWSKQAKKAESSGVQICLEMHPGFSVYNPETLLKLRNACGNSIGANFDPSHLIWQGIDIIEAIKCLGDALFFFHAKDTGFNQINKAINGVLDTKPYSDEINRSWIFRTVGYGSGEKFWKDVCTALRLIGYDYYMSIEHEDSLIAQDEGLEKAIDFMKSVMIKKPKLKEMWW